MKFRLAALLALTLLAGCRTSGDSSNDSGGVYAVRSACPIAGVPAGTGDITLFDPAGSTDSRAIDVTASDHQCPRDLRRIRQRRGFDRNLHWSSALRSDASPARQVVLPYFDVALQGGETVAAKQIGQVVLNFPAGDIRGWPGSRRRSGSTAPPRPCRPTVRRESDPRAQAGRGRRRDRPVDRSGDSRRGRPCDVRASGRLPADRGSAPLQRHPLSAGGRPRLIDSRARGGQGSPLSPAAWSPERQRGRVRPLPPWSGRRRRSNRPRNLSGTRTARA